VLGIVGTAEVSHTVFTGTGCDHGDHDRLQSRGAALVAHGEPVDLLDEPDLRTLGNAPDNGEPNAHTSARCDEGRLG